MTNADRIRQMTDEELAKMLIRDVCSMCAGESNENCGASWFCETGILAWMKQEDCNESDAEKSPDEGTEAPPS